MKNKLKSLWDAYVQNYMESCSQRFDIYGINDETIYRNEKTK